MLECICEICGKEFLRKKSQIKLAIKHYCSRFCAEKGRRKGKFVFCTFCGERVYRQLRDLRRSRSGKYFCSNKCLLRWIYKKYKGQSNWKNGLHTEYRKKLIKHGNQDTQCMLCKEQNFQTLIAHHVDKNRSNNLIKNLVWLCFNCHFLVHHYKEEEKQLQKTLYEKKM